MVGHIVAGHERYCSTIVSHRDNPSARERYVPGVSMPYDEHLKVKEPRYSSPSPPASTALTFVLYAIGLIAEISKNDG